MGEIECCLLKRGQETELITLRADTSKAADCTASKDVEETFKELAKNFPFGSDRMKVKLAT